MENFRTWRELLGKIIQDVQEKQRIALALGVTAITLSRWVNNQSTPRPQHLRLLLNIAPHYRASMLELIQQEFPEISLTNSNSLQDVAPVEIPAEFYSRVFNSYSLTPRLQRSWSISSLILQQALGQLDPHQVGLAITIVQCMPPSLDGKVCSLRERAGYGTPPWNINLEPYAVFLGAESLAGYVVGSCHPRIIQNSNEHRGIVPAHWVEWERSAAAYPIFRANKVAGCLLVSCAEPNYFTPAREKLIQRYAELLVLIFEPHEFYDLHLVNLRVLPYYRVQEEYLSGFRQRVSELMTNELRNGRAIDLRQAEALVWQQVEKELWLLPPYIGRVES